MKKELHQSKPLGIVKVVSSAMFLLMAFCINGNAQNWQLVWSDEFNGTGAPDPLKWGYELGGNIRNSELQYYTNSLNNVKQNNGNLEITVIKENAGGKEYTSGSITTLGKADWTYGKIEGRFKMPKGQGLWACFWTLGSNFPQVGWPKSGEIDINEHINNENIYHATAHWAGRNDRHVSAHASYNIDVTQWHTYSIIWDGDYIRWHVDDIQFHQLQITAAQNFTHEFHLPQYILINLPIGGTWPGPPDATTILPATMYCDYVRVYKNTSTNPVALAAFSISPASATVAVGGTLPINPVFIPANTTNQNITWTSSNTAVATVNSAGVVTAVGLGSATITATTADGNKTATCAITTQNLIGVNKLVNGNFDSDTKLTQVPKGWSEWSSTTGVANAQNSNASPYSAPFKGIQSGTTHYDVAVFQALTGLSNGNYTLKAWVRSSGGQSTSLFYAKNYGGPEQNYSLTTAIPVWTQIVIDNVIVTNNKCEVGFYQWTGSANKWIEYDNVEFYMVSTSDTVITNSVSAQNTIATNKSPSAFPLQNSKGVSDRGSGSFSIFPNPVIPGKVLHIQSAGFAEYDLEITSVSGSVVYSKRGIKGEFLRMTVPDLPSGMYFVRIRTKKSIQVTKLVLND